MNTIHTKSGTPHSMGTAAPRPHPVLSIFIRCSSVSLDTESFPGVGKNTGGAEVRLSKRLWSPWLFINHSFQDPRGWEVAPPALLCPRESLAL